MKSDVSSVKKNKDIDKSIFAEILDREDVFYCLLKMVIVNVFCYTVVRRGRGHKSRSIDEKERRDKG